MSYVFKTDRLIIETSDVSLTDRIFKYYYDNKDFFEKHEPVQPANYYTREYQKLVMEQEAKNMANKLSAYFYYSLKDEPDKIIGSISFVRIRKEPYASTIFGYNQHEDYQGHGYCTEACKASMDFVLKFARIHRIESRVMPDNEKSIHILERLGFFHEGFEKASILIGGEFRDHLRYAYINENY